MNKWRDMTMYLMTYSLKCQFTKNCFIDIIQFLSKSAIVFLGRNNIIKETISKNKGTRIAKINLKKKQNKMEGNSLPS